MKKITLLAIAVVAISLASCKKERECECTTTSTAGSSSSTGTYTVKYAKISKGDAKTVCTKTSNVSTNTAGSSSYITDCKIK